MQVLFFFTTTPCLACRPKGHSVRENTIRGSRREAQMNKLTVHKGTQKIGDKCLQDEKTIQSCENKSSTAIEEHPRGSKKLSGKAKQLSAAIQRATTIDSDQLRSVSSNYKQPRETTINYSTQLPKTKPKNFDQLWQLRHHRSYCKSRKSIAESPTSVSNTRH